MLSKANFLRSNFSSSGLLSKYRIDLFEAMTINEINELINDVIISPFRWIRLEFLDSFIGQETGPKKGENWTTKLNLDLFGQMIAHFVALDETNPMSYSMAQMVQSGSYKISQQVNPQSEHLYRLGLCSRAWKYLWH